MGNAPRVCSRETYYNGQPKSIAWEVLGLCKTFQSCLSRREVNGDYEAPFPASRCLKSVRQGVKTKGGFIALREIVCLFV